MNISKERKIEEGLLRLKELEVAFDLRPNIYKYFKEGKLYYSYLIGGLVGCIDTINYDERYAKVVKKFEEIYGYVVYHVIESYGSIALLYVSNDEEDWECERLFDNTYISAYVHNLESLELSEFGDIVVSSSEGALIRVD